MGKLVWMDMLNAINVDSKISRELMRYFQGLIKSDHNNMYNREMDVLCTLLKLVDLISKVLPVLIAP